MNTLLLFPAHIRIFSQQVMGLSAILSVIGRRKGRYRYTPLAFIIATYFSIKEFSNPTEKKVF